MLRDCLVCGLAQVQSQQCLLAEVDPNFDKATKTVQAIELAEHNTREFGKPRCIWSSQSTKCIAM